MLTLGFGALRLPGSRLTTLTGAPVTISGGRERHGSFSMISCGVAGTDTASVESAGVSTCTVLGLLLRRLGAGGIGEATSVLEPELPLSGDSFTLARSSVSFSRDSTTSGETLRFSACSISDTIGELPLCFGGGSPLATRAREIPPLRSGWLFVNTRVRLAGRSLLMSNPPICDVISPRELRLLSPLVNE